MPFPINLVRWVMNLTYSGQNGPNKRDVNKMSTTRSITDARILFQPGKRFKKLINSTEFEKIQE